jgi:hypothetical protein
MWKRSYLKRSHSTGLKRRNRKEERQREILGEELPRQQPLDGLENKRRRKEEREREVGEEPLEKELLNKLEKKRRKKEERQREMLGKQPMPEWYAKPSIPPLGKKWQDPRRI